MQHSVRQLIVAFLAGHEALDAFVWAVEGLFELFKPEHEVGHLLDEGIVNGKWHLKEVKKNTQHVVVRSMSEIRICLKSKPLLVGFSDT